MKTKLSAGIGSGLVMSLLVVGGLFLALGASTPVAAAADKVSFCHLQQKVDPDLVFNDGKVINVAKAACAAHCGHGDQPMPVPADNEAHPNRACARIHVVNGLPNCEVNTLAVSTICSVEACIARCQAS